MFVEVSNEWKKFYAMHVLPRDMLNYFRLKFASVKMFNQFSIGFC